MRGARAAAWSCGVAGAVVLVSTGLAGAARAPRCGVHEVRRTVVYVQRKGARKRRVTGCVPRLASGADASTTAALRGMRSFALRFASAAFRRALRSPAGRRLLAVDPVTDRSLAKSAGLDPVAGAAGATGSGGHPNETPLDGPPGTHSIVYGDGKSLDSDFQVGKEFDATTETTTNRISGQSARKVKRLKVRYLMDRCPDGGGTAHGTLTVSLRETTVISLPNGGRVESTTLSDYDGAVTAHADETARISAVEVTGGWTFSSRSSRSVRGTTSAKGFQQSPTPGKNPGDGYDNHVDLQPTTTTATDDGVAVAGNVAGAYVLILPEGIVNDDMLNPLQIRLLGGVCAKIVPNAETVHVRPAGTVAIVAHLKDLHGTTFAGPITAFNANDRVTPTTAQASNDATFTYSALSVPPSGGTDVVVLRHVSHHGKAPGTTVTVVYDKSQFPKRFDGTWTRTITPVGPGPVETIHGTAAFVRNPAIGAEAEGLTQIPYTLAENSESWSIDGVITNGSCTTTFSGSGTDTGDTDGLSGLLLEDVSAKNTTPKPDPQPYWFDIQVFDHSRTPLYTTTLSGPEPPCVTGTMQNEISGNYFDVGDLASFDAGPDPAKLQKSANIALLEGHRVTSDDVQTIDDTWSFTGSS